MLFTRLAQQMRSDCPAIEQPAALLLFVYIMSGTDYVPGFKHITFFGWVRLLLQYYATFVAVASSSIGTEAAQAPTEPMLRVTSQHGGTLMVSAAKDAVLYASLHYWWHPCIQLLLK